MESNVFLNSCQLKKHNIIFLDFIRQLTFWKHTDKKPGVLLWKIDFNFRPGGGVVVVVGRFDHTICSFFESSEKNSA